MQAPVPPSPYYFVPRNDRLALFTPTEAQAISQDHPFKDGHCGSFQVTLTATTPIFVRDSATPSHSFTLPGGRFAIPPSSIQGAIRHIVGAASFGKLKRIADRAYSVRNMKNTKYVDALRERRAGWLRLTETGPEIRECDWGYIAQTELEVSYPGLKLGVRQTAAEKYGQWRTLAPKNPTVTGIKAKYRSQKPPPGKPKQPVPEAHKVHGTLVLSGQARNRPVERGPNDTTKGNENVFGPPKAQARPVPSDVFARFIELHEDPEGLWQTEWRGRFEKGEVVPVFFGADDTDVISHFGLSEMMRIPSKVRLTDRLGPNREQHLGDALDLPDALFGHAAETDGQGLRRRADFGVFTALGEVHPLATVTTLMGEPKASYYPNYLEQPPGGGLTNYLDEPKPGQPWPGIRGRKFYPAREDGTPHTLPHCDPESKMKIEMTPLDAGAVFSGRCFIHNLRPFEIGALLWSLTLGEPNHESSPYRLRIGGGRPHGLGCVRVSLSNLQLRRNDGTALPEGFLSDCLKAFEDWVAGKLGMTIEAWRSSPQIRELRAIHRHDHGVGPEQLRYPNFPDPKKKMGNQGLNEFDYAIDKARALPDFSTLQHVRPG